MGASATGICEALRMKTCYFEKTRRHGDPALYLYGVVDPDRGGLGVVWFTLKSGIGVLSRKRGER